MPVLLYIPINKTNNKCDQQNKNVCLIKKHVILSKRVKWHFYEQKTCWLDFWSMLNACLIKCYMHFSSNVACFLLINSGMLFDQMLNDKGNIHMWSTKHLTFDKKWSIHLVTFDLKNYDLIRHLFVKWLFDQTLNVLLIKC